MDKYTNSLQKLSPQAHLILRGRMFSSILHRAAEDGRRAENVVIIAGHENIRGAVLLRLFDVRV